MICKRSFSSCKQSPEQNLSPASTSQLLPITSFYQQGLSVHKLKYVFLFPASNYCSKSNNPPCANNIQEETFLRSVCLYVSVGLTVHWCPEGSQGQVHECQKKRGKKVKESRSSNSRLLKRTKNTAEFLLPYASATKYLRHPFYLIQIPHE